MGGWTPREKLEDEGCIERAEGEIERWMGINRRRNRRQGDMLINKRRRGGDTLAWTNATTRDPKWHLTRLRSQRDILRNGMIPCHNNIMMRWNVARNQGFKRMVQACDTIIGSHMAGHKWLAL